MDMEPIRIIAFSISGSVGKGGVNNSDDVLSIQTLLNGIPQELGGAFPRLTEDGKKTGPNWDRTVEAISIFQTTHFGWKDGRVDVEGKTHRAMRTALLKRDKPAPRMRFVEVLPNDGMDHTATPNPWQMVPLNAFKRVRLLGSLKEELLTHSFSTPKIAEVVSIEQDVYNLRGLLPGTTTLTVKQGAREIAKLDIAVRSRKTIPLKLHYVRDGAKGTKFGIGDGATLLNGINGIYTPQINIAFTLQGEREIKSINGTAVKFDQEFYWEDTVPIPATVQKFTDADMIAESPGRPGVCHVFMVWEMQSAPGARSDLNGITITGKGPCAVEDKTRLNRFRTIAHEIGHYLGCPHDSDSFSLMCDGNLANDNGNRIRKAAADIMNAT